MNKTVLIFGYNIDDSLGGMNDFILICNEGDNYIEKIKKYEKSQNYKYHFYEIFEVAIGLIILVEDYKEIKKRNIVEVLN